MDKKLSKLTSWSFVTFSGIAPHFAFEEDCTVEGNKINLCTNDVTVEDIIIKVTNWVLGFGAAIAVLFIIFAGLKYLTAAGNEKQAESAKQTLTSAVIGLIVILLAYVIVGLVASATNGVLTAPTPSATVTTP